MTCQNLNLLALNVNFPNYFLRPGLFFAPVMEWPLTKVKSLRRGGSGTAKSYRIPYYCVWLSWFPPSYAT
jgi:hypothetical protein